jgi:hypothetical protein
VHAQQDPGHRDAQRAEENRKTKWRRKDLTTVDVT